MGRDFKNDFIDNEPVMDSVYGVIKISPFEKRLIATKEMQRLRGIKQLGFVNLVYPDAEHSRFAHSIGVCHQSKVIIDQVVKNISNSRKFQIWRNKFIKDDDNRKQIKSVDYEVITHVEKIIISAAALLHDLPHSPFSHEIETHTSDGKGIPVHDDFKNNPIFFRYLFDKEKSDLAKIIEIYNSTFWQLVKTDQKWWQKLKDKNDIDADGYVIISENDSQDAILNGSKDIIPDNKLPILGVMIFELLLFDKTEMWVRYENNKITPNYKGVEIIVNFKKDTITWKPNWKWFRPYRKDIVANTICSDLLDYLLRDGRNTGILSALDLKFFDRMTITKAYPDKTTTLINPSDIPDFCEHIVFDIFDHKRGVIRQSIITEILSFLQQRYLLAERVYQHRVVEGARTMLQEASRILTSTDSIKIEDLHSFDKKGFTPMNDEAFFAWVLNIEDKGNKEIIKAKKLVKMLQERRVFREAVIIDNDEDSHKGTYRGNEVDYQTLADVLLNDVIRNKIIDKLNLELTSFCVDNDFVGIPNYKEELLFTIGVRKFGKGYKIPRVLVCRPLNNHAEDNIEIFPLFEAKKIPAMNDRLESMQKSYKSLWKVYLFMHPFFHKEKYKELHDRIESIFVISLFEETNIMWKNSIEDFKQLLPENAIDIDSFINDFSKEEISEKMIMPFVSKIFAIANKSIDDIDFKLDAKNIGHTNAIIKKLKKSEKGNEILINKPLQDKLIKVMSKFKIEPLPIAAHNKEELVIDQIVNGIEKTINEVEKDSQKENPLGI